VLLCVAEAEILVLFMQQMFAFGTKALEQFVNRLDEWPQYCNHILQISHLRSTHPELVTYIEGVLAQRSHGANGPVDQLNISTMSTPVNEVSQMVLYLLSLLFKRSVISWDIHEIILEW